MFLRSEYGDFSNNDFLFATPQQPKAAAQILTLLVTFQPPVATLM